MIYFSLTLITRGAIVISSGTDTLSILAAPIARAVAEVVVGQEEELYATLGMTPTYLRQQTHSEPDHRKLPNIQLHKHTSHQHSSPHYDSSYSHTASTLKGRMYICTYTVCV